MDAVATHAVRIARQAWFVRSGSAVLALGIGGVFTLSALLVPSPDGHGTHLQLGLGTCTFLAMTGQPCPMCGATTSFALMAHLRPIEALINQPFAAFLFCLSAGVLGVAVAETVDPRRRWDRILTWLGPRESAFAAVFLGFMLVSWVYKIARMAGLL
ncbi:MAG: DUF2752 domain-containing protein [Myxococcota bacterium]